MKVVIELPMDEVDNLVKENKRMRDGLGLIESDIKSLIDHLFNIGLDEAWTICKLNDILDNINYTIKEE